MIQKISQRKLRPGFSLINIYAKRLIRNAKVEQCIIKALIKNLIWSQSLSKSSILPGLERLVGQDLQKFNKNIRINRRAWYLNVPSSKFKHQKIVLKVAARSYGF